MGGVSATHAVWCTESTTGGPGVAKVRGRWCGGSPGGQVADEADPPSLRCTREEFLDLRREKSEKGGWPDGGRGVTNWPH